MLDIGIVERSRSAYDTPVLVVIMSDKAHRLCFHFRGLNVALQLKLRQFPGRLPFRRRWYRKVFFAARIL